MGFNQRPQPLAGFSATTLKGIKAVFFDIDDTFSTDGKIEAEAYSALWRLHELKLLIIPVTGRPAGWCDFIARMWPVTAVVGENGAFSAQMKGGRLKKTYLESASVRVANAHKLKKLSLRLKRAFPQAHWASDQAFREFDLAIDYCEDVKPWKDSEVERLLDFCHRAGAQAKLSSIHVNAWYGRYDKWSCVKKILKAYGLKDLNQVVYLGDSPNDEPFFERLPLTVGVANVEKFLARMTYGPTYIAPSAGGAGFAEFVSNLVASHY